MLHDDVLKSACFAREQCNVVPAIKPRSLISWSHFSCVWGVYFFLPNRAFTCFFKKGSRMSRINQVSIVFLLEYFLSICNLWFQHDAPTENILAAENVGDEVCVDGQEPSVCGVLHTTTFTRVERIGYMHFIRIQKNSWWFPRFQSVHFWRKNVSWGYVFQGGNATHFILMSGIVQKSSLMWNLFFFLWYNILRDCHAVVNLFEYKSRSWNSACEDFETMQW